MIEKLDPIKHTDNLYDKNGFITNVACGGVVISKINEVVDAVNSIVNVQEKLIDSRFVVETKNELPDGDDAIQEVIHADPYAEQRKWIGKLCKFWNFKDGAVDIGILKAVDNLKPTIPYINDIDCSYAFCEPVKPDDDIIFKGE